MTAGLAVRHACLPASESLPPTSVLEEAAASCETASRTKGDDL